MLWIKARRAHTLLPAVLAAFTLLVTFVQDTSVYLPSFGGAAHVALALFIPVPLVAGLMLCLESRLPAAEISGVRRISLLDAALTVATMVTAIVCALTVDALLDVPLAAATGRNTLFLTGLMLCGRALLGQPGVMIPVAWLFLVVLAGFRSSNDPYPWTIVPEPPGAPHAALGAVLVFTLGILVQLRTPRKLP
ncbi:hypothetical protein ACIO1C_17895 [Streptomyces sp. NPDC087420]|uniref:hypothetical protein n=1 Tax=Streptomyces sp. NPDC087420 TaxID=3365785 RepID=UPI003836E474